MLFEREGTSMTAFVRDVRLKLAHSMLLSPRFRERRIGELAFAAGSNELSCFNRSFRRFGRSPNEVRES
jgi:AraC-like DNA-binding protein